MIATRSSRSTIPALRLEDDAEYARAAAKLAELRARAEALERERTAMVTARPAAVADQLADAAAALLGAARAPAPARPLAVVAAELAAYRGAVALAADALEAERRRVSATICAALAPEYRRIIRRKAALCREWLALDTEEQALHRGLQDGEVRSTLRAMPLVGLGFLSAHEDNAMTQWLREAAAFELLTD